MSALADGLNAGFLQGNVQIPPEREEPPPGLINWERPGIPRKALSEREP